MSDVVTSRPSGPVIRPYAPRGLATCLEGRRLTRDGTPLVTSRLEVEALCVAEWANARRRTVVLCPAYLLVPLSALIAAAVHLADIAEGVDLYRRTGIAGGSRRRVAVVTTDYRIRGSYRALGVRPDTQSPSAALRSVVPAATLASGGVIHVLDARTDRPWSTIFVPSVADLAGLHDVDLVVIELPADIDVSRLEGGPPTVIVARDPADPIVDALARRVPVFAWSEEDARRLALDGELPPRLRCQARGVRCEIVAVPHQSLCTNAGLFWQDIGPLVRLSRRSSLGRELARDAFALFHDLLGLALPLKTYEEMTTPVRVRLAAIARAGRLTSGRNPRSLHPDGGGGTCRHGQRHRQYPAEVRGHAARPGSPSG